MCKNKIRGGIIGFSVKALLLGLMVLGLAACGKGGQPEQTGVELATAVGPQEDTSPKWRYAAEPLDIGADQGDYYYTVKSGDGLYYPVRDRDAEGENVSGISRYSLTDGSVEQLPIEIKGGVPVKLDVGADGFVCAIVSYRGADGEAVRKLEKYDPNGKQIYAIDIEEWTGDNWQVEFVTDGEGRGYLTREGQIFLFDAQGGFAGSMEALGGGTGCYVRAACRGKDGRVYVCATDHNFKASLLEIDYAGRSARVVQEGFANCEAGGLTVGQEMDLLVQDGAMVYGYDLSGQTRETLLAWADSGIKGSRIRGFWETDDGKIIAVQDAEAEKEGGILALSRLSEEEIPEMEELVLGILFPSQITEDIVADFNADNDRYHITIKNYAGDEPWGLSTEEWSAIQMRMVMEISSGDGPDLIEDISLIELENLTKQGAIEDLAPWLERSTTLKRTDFVENTLEAGVHNGVLANLPRTFDVYAVMGRAADVGKNGGLSLEEFMALPERHPGTQLADCSSKDYLLYYCMEFGIDAFVDWEAGTCSFDSPEFVELLEFINRYGAAGNGGDADDTERYQRGEILLSFREYHEFLEGIQETQNDFAGEACQVGLPTPDGRAASLLNITSGCSMSAASKHKEGAWAFLEYYVKADHRYDSEYFRTLEVALEEQLESLKFERQKEVNRGRSIYAGETDFVKYEKDDEGNVIYDENGLPVIKELILRINLGNGISYHAVTDEEGELMMEIIRSARPQNGGSFELRDLIQEEAAYFFEGQKSAEQVADVIQNRVRIYLSENQ